MRPLPKNERKKDHMKLLPNNSLNLRQICNIKVVQAARIMFC